MIKHTIDKPFYIKWWMNFFGYRGLTTFFNTIYYIDGVAMSDESLQRHELMHITQMKRDGKLVFFFKYNWYWLTRGYINNPYEIEARGAENV